jgi:DNA-binding transcriptional ArsR family regulator
MTKISKKTESRRDIFYKVNVIFKNPLRVDILQELSILPQRPIDLAKKFGVQQQVINYHLTTLRKSGLIKEHKKELPRSGKVLEKLGDMKGVRVKGMTESGKIEVSYGLELTESGKKIAKQFVNKLYQNIEKKS